MFGFEEPDDHHSHGEAVFDSIPGYELIKGSGGSGSHNSAPSTGGPNLTITSAFLVDANNQPISAPVIGEMVFVRATWSYTNMASTPSFNVAFSVDGVTVYSNTITHSGSGSGAFWYRGGWYATSGQHTVNVTVDGTNTVSEGNEADNSLQFSFTTALPTDLPTKFSSPMSGDQFADWRISNYVDVDPTSGVADFSGRPLAYDGHAGWDITPYTFNVMDAGLAILAAAEGTVVDTDDGHFDRESTSNPSHPGNYVILDHGNGWQSFYWHFAAGTVTVQAGDVVTRGQVLGLAGSSGYTDGVHLHFSIAHNGSFVETNYSPAVYWHDPWEPEWENEIAVLDHGVSNSTLSTGPGERPLDQSVFSRTAESGEQMRFWYTWSYVPPGTTYTVRWVRPDSQIALSSTNTAEGYLRGTYWWWVTGYWEQMPGTWHIQLIANGETLVSQPVQVIDGNGPAELLVRENGLNVVNARTTAINVTPGVTKTLSLFNYGTSNLNISNIVLPEGFVIFGSAPTTVAPNSAVNLNLRANTTLPGIYQGDVIIQSNDVDDPSYRFRIRSEVGGAPTAGTPVVSLPGPAVYDVPDGQFQRLDSLATVSDTDAPANATGYVLRAEIVSGGATGDSLQVRPHGPVDLNGNSVRRSGVVIGTLQTFSGGRLAVTFNSSATLIDVQHVTRALAFDAGSRTSPSGQRVVSVKVTDQSGNTSGPAYKTFVVPRYNLPPTDLFSSSVSIQEGQAVGTAVGTLSVADADGGDTFTYALVTGTGSADNASFTIVGNQLRTAAVFDYETKSSYSIRIRVKDQGGLSFERALLIQVIRGNTRPSGILLSATSIPQNRPIGTTVGTLSAVDPDVGDTFTYSLVSGSGDEDNASFTISGNQLKTAAVFNAAVKNSYKIRIRVTDAAGTKFEKVFTISVTSSNTRPTDLTLTPASVLENKSAGTIVGTLSAVDPDVGDTFTYELVPGSGSDDNFRFTVDGNKLKTSEVFNYEQDSLHKVRLRVTDAAGTKFEKVFNISVLDGNDRPTGINLSSNKVVRNQPVGSLVGTLAAVDADSADTFTYELVSGAGSTHNSSFAIVGNQLISATTFDGSRSIFYIRIRVTDEAGTKFEKMFQVKRINTRPTDLSLTSTSVAENAAIGTVVGQFSATDPDLGDTLSYTLVSGAGADDNANFTIVGNQLRTAKVFDFELKSSYSIRVQVADAAGAKYQAIFQIMVTDQPELA